MRVITDLSCVLTVNPKTNNIFTEPTAHYIVSCEQIMIGQYFNEKNLNNINFHVVEMIFFTFKQCTNDANLCGTRIQVEFFFQEQMKASFRIL